jgi:uncharacterized membrane protein
MKVETIDTYLSELKRALNGCDKAIIQDALADAEEHLRIALENFDNTTQNHPEAQMVQTIIEEYGTPEEIAEAYREIETYTRPSLAAIHPRKRGALARFFGIFADPQAWGSVVYLLISLVTGTLYFSWVFTGFSSSIIFALFIFGLPFAAFFVLSLRGLALLEGRIVEALLGVRMPRRAVFSPPNLTWRERLKSQLTDKQTWLMMVYMILQGVLGVVYFSLIIILIATAVLFIGSPVISGMDLPVVIFNGVEYFVPVAAFPFTIAFGILIATLTMHLAKFLGKWHGRYAKMMLVGE